MRRAMLGLTAVLALAGCGGGGGGGSTASTAAPPAAAAALPNFVAVAVDGGPAALNTGPNAYVAANIAYVSVTVCAPGGATCQTIDHVTVDTGSVGLRVLGSALNGAMQAALPHETDAQSNAVGECYEFGDGYVFGAVRLADVQIGGEQVSDMPLQVVGEGGAFAAVPGSCSSGGGPALTTVQDLSANGILGIGVTPTDCGTTCTTAGGSTYYDCPASGCGATTARASSASAPFQQLPNPVAAMAVDNNGSILTLPAVASGAASAAGALYFGIGTRTNNALGSATIIPSGSRGAGFFTAVYKNQTLDQSFIDSGSSFYLFVDRSIAQCTDAALAGFYCPAAPLALDATMTGLNDAALPVAFTLDNAQSALSGGGSAFPRVGLDPDGFDNLRISARSFDFGLPFFYGRSVYTAIAGRTAGGTEGPYYAF